MSDPLEALLGIPGLPVEPVPIEADEEMAKKKKAAEAPADKPPEPPKRTCTIDQVLTPQTILLLQSAPTNEVNRTLALAALKKPIPDEHKTYEAIRDWVEFNFKPPRTRIPKTDEGLAMPAIQLPYEFHKTESGTCRYQRRMSRSSRIAMQPQIVLEAVRLALEEEMNWTEFHKHMQEVVKNQLLIMPPSLAPDTPNLTDMVPDHTTSPQVVTNSSTFTDYLYRWMSANQPEQLRQIENR